MEDNLDFTNINTHFDSIIKKGQEIHNLEVESKSKRQKIYESEIALIKNQHHSELEDVRTEQSEKNRKIIFEKESEIAHLKNLHNLDVAEFQNELKKVKGEHKSEITDVKNQHHSELEKIDIRTEQSEKNRIFFFEYLESEIVHLKNLHILEVDRIKADFQKELEKEIEKIKQQNINQIKQLKQQHQYELVEIRREINEKPKVTKISSEETTKPSDIK